MVTFRNQKFRWKNKKFIQGKPVLQNCMFKYYNDKEKNGRCPPTCFVRFILDRNYVKSHVVAVKCLFVFHLCTFVLLHIAKVSTTWRYYIFYVVQACRLDIFPLITGYWICRNIEVFWKFSLEFWENYWVFGENIYNFE